MPVSQLCHRPDGIEPGILAQRVGDDLQRLREGLEAVGVGAGERVGVEHELTRHLRLRGAAAGNQEPLLHQATDHAQGVVQRSIIKKYKK